MKDELEVVLKPAREKAKTSEVAKKIRAAYPKDIYKELKKWGDKTKTRMIRANKTLYRWWWDYLRAARDFPEAEKKTAKRKNAKITKKAKPSSGTRQSHPPIDVPSLFGELGDNFREWWDATGKNIFVETELPLIQVLKPLPDDETYKREVGVVMIVPMTLSRPLLMDQFKIVLDIYHPNQNFRRHTGSSAQARLHDRTRDTDVDYERLLKVWRARRRNMKLSKDKKQLDWELYCDVFNLRERKRQLKANKDVDACLEMAREIRRLYLQADELVRNAVLGSFPNDEEFQRSKGRKNAAERRRENKKTKQNSKKTQPAQSS